MTNRGSSPLTLRAPARTSAAHALITTAISHHDRAAEAARRRVAQVDDAGQGVGGMDRVRRGHGGRERPPYIFRLRAEGGWPRSQVLKQQLLLAGEEAQLQPAENVVHDRLGKADPGGPGAGARLKSAVRDGFAPQL